MVQIIIYRAGGIMLNPNGYICKDDIEYQVGDVVQVVDQPIRCRWGWVSNMDSLCGAIVHIIGKRESPGGEFVYKLAEDPSMFSWCCNCFVRTEESETLPDVLDDSFSEIVGVS